MSATLHAVDLNNGQMSARLLTLGAAVQDLRLSGWPGSLVLGHADPNAYRTNPGYLGVIVGRVANRIAGGRGVIDGTPFDFDCNDQGVQTLHGGRDGAGVQNWRILDHSPTHVRFGLTLPHLHMGFPGTLSLQARYELDGTALDLQLSAQTDAPTLCNLAPHHYFNLSGAETIADHRLSISADQYLPVDKGIPRGGPAPVAGTRFDLRAPAPIPDGLDHNFCLSRHPAPLRPVAVLQVPGLAMDLLSTEPGLQAYDGAGLPTPRAGVALEPQRWPDAVNAPWRDQTDLIPGQVYTSRSRFCFRRQD